MIGEAVNPKSIDLNCDRSAWFNPATGKKEIGAAYDMKPDVLRTNSRKDSLFWKVSDDCVDYIEKTIGYSTNDMSSLINFLSKEWQYAWCTKNSNNASGYYLFEDYYIKKGFQYRMNPNT